MNCFLVNRIKTLVTVRLVRLRWKMLAGCLLYFSSLIYMRFSYDFSTFSFIYKQAHISQFEQVDEFFVSLLLLFIYKAYNPYRLNSNETTFQPAYNSIRSDTLEVNSTWNHSSILLYSSFWNWIFFLCTLFCRP